MSNFQALFALAIMFGGLLVFRLVINRLKLSLSTRRIFFFIFGICLLIFPQFLISEKGLYGIDNGKIIFFIALALFAGFAATIKGSDADSSVKKVVFSSEKDFLNPLAQKEWKTFFVGVAIWAVSLVMILMFLPYNNTSFLIFILIFAAGLILIILFLYAKARIFAVTVEGEELKIKGIFSTRTFAISDIIGVFIAETGTGMGINYYLVVRERFTQLLKFETSTLNLFDKLRILHTGNFFRSRGLKLYFLSPQNYQKIFDILQKVLELRKTFIYIDLDKYEFWVPESKSDELKNILGNDAFSVSGKNHKSHLVFWSIFTAVSLALLVLFSSIDPNTQVGMFILTTFFLGFLSLIIIVIIISRRTLR